jgi:hypothetical protein
MEMQSGCSSTSKSVVTLQLEPANFQFLHFVPQECEADVYVFSAITYKTDKENSVTVSMEWTGRRSTRLWLSKMMGMPHRLDSPHQPVLLSPRRRLPSGLVSPLFSNISAQAHQGQFLIQTAVRVLRDDIIYASSGVLSVSLITSSFMDIWERNKAHGIAMFGKSLLLSMVTARHLLESLE